MLYLPVYLNWTCSKYQCLGIKPSTHSNVHLSKILVRRNQHIQGEGIKNLLKEKTVGWSRGGNASVWQVGVEHLNHPFQMLSGSSSVTIRSELKISFVAACRQGYITSSAEAEELNSCSQGFSCRYSSTAPPVASTTHQKLAVDFDHPSQLLVLSVWISWRIISSEACWLVWINTVYHHLVRLSICTRNWISSIRSSILSYSVLFSKSVILNSWCTVFWGCNIWSYQVDWITWNPDQAARSWKFNNLESSWSSVLQ